MVYRALFQSSPELGQSDPPTQLGIGIYQHAVMYNTRYAHNIITPVITMVLRTIIPIYLTTTLSGGYFRGFTPKIPPPGGPQGDPQGTPLRGVPLRAGARRGGNYPPRVTVGI